MFKQFPPVTKNLLIINCIVFLLQLVGEQRGYNLVDSFGLHFVLADDFRPWQLVSYMFLHGSFTHLFFNMFSLWMFGRIVEQAMGLKKFLIYYFVCGIGAGVCQELWQFGQYYIEGMGGYDWVALTNETGATVEQVTMGAFLNSWNTVGASGACYGVLLAFGMAFPNERIMLLIPPIPLKAKYFVAGYAVIELLSAYASNDNVAHFAHLGGMLFGLLLILYWRHGGPRRPRFNGWETWTPRRSSSPWERFWNGVTGCFKSVGNTLRRFFALFRPSRPRMKVRQGGKQFKDREADYDYNARTTADDDVDNRMDKILDKIRRSGYTALTEEEKKYLFHQTKK